MSISCLCCLDMNIKVWFSFLYMYARKKINFSCSCCFINFIHRYKIDIVHFKSLSIHTCICIQSVYNSTGAYILKISDDLYADMHH